MKKTFTFFLVIALLIHFNLFAGQINFTYTNHILGITKINGVWWLATDGGLVRFDVSNNGIKVFNRGNSNIPTNHIRFVDSDENGNVWVGTLKGIGKFDGETFVNYNTENSGLLSDTVKLMDYEKGKGLWVVTQNAISFFDGSQWVNYYTDDDGDSLNNITAISASSSYGVLLANGNKVEFLTNEGTFVNEQFPGNVSYPGISGVGFDFWNNVVVSTYTQGVWRMDNNGNWQQYTDANSPLTTPDISGMEISPQYDIYLYNYQNGFAVWHRDDTWDVFPVQDGDTLAYINTLYAGDMEVALGLPYPQEGFIIGTIDDSYNYGFSGLYNLQTSPVNGNTVYDIEIKNGKKYLGCTDSKIFSGEIDVVDENNSLEKKYSFIDYDNANLIIPELLTVDYYGNIWASEKFDANNGSNEGLVKISGDNVEVLSGADLGVSSAFISSLQWVTTKNSQNDVIGTLWAEVYSDGYSRVMYLDSVWHQLPNDPQNYPAGFYQILQDSLGMWFASGRIYSYDGTAYHSYWDEAPVKIANSVVRDKYGNVWFGAQPNESNGWPGGIAIYYGDNEWGHLTAANSDLPDDYVTCLARDTVGNIWVGTRYGGLVKVDTLMNMTVFNDENSFLDNNWIEKIAVDPVTNDIWIVNLNSGVFVYNETSDIANGIKYTEHKTDNKITVKNYPNPFDEFTKIEFQLPEKEFVNLDIYSLDGKKITTLVNNMLEKGKHEVEFDANGFQPGIYIYRIVTVNGGLSGKMVISR